MRKRRTVVTMMKMPVGVGVGNTSTWMPSGFLENCKSGKLAWLKQSITY